MKTLHLAAIIGSGLVLIIIGNSGLSFAQNETQPTIYFRQPGYATITMSCNDEIPEKVLAQEPAQNKAAVIITDPRANKYSTAIDRVAVHVWSDSDKKGIEITAYETAVNSGIFNGTFTVSDGPSTQDILHVSDGDTITANYTGTTPWSPGTANYGMTTTAFIGLLCPPLERVPASGIDITDNEGNQLKTILVNKQIQIGSNLTNITIRNQTFAYIVQISDGRQNMETISSVSGLLLPHQTFSPSVSWIPTRAGNYTVQVFVWQSINNPNALSPPLSSDLTVWSSASTANYAINSKNPHCQADYELVTKSSNNSPVCVTPDTAQRLVERGWERETTSNNSDITNSTLGNKILPASFEPCNTPYQESNTGIPVFYMPANSTGNLCAKYSNPNEPFQAGFDILEARNYGKKAEGTTTYSVPDMVPQGNNTVMYTIHSGPKAGFFRMLISCPGMQLAIGYDNSSNFVRSDFPWLDQTFYCGIGHEFSITGMSGIGVKFIPYK